MLHNVVAALIMRDEADVCERCVISLQAHVPFVLVSDTGSQDNTVDKLRNMGVTVYRDVWQDFATNRNIALRCAEQNYATCTHTLCGIDADEILHVPDGYTWPPLDADGYNIECRYGNITYNRLALVRHGLWEWKGVIHEALVPLIPNPVVHTLLGPWIEVRNDGARAKDPGTQRKDLMVLQNEVARDPTNARYLFYLAQTYRDLGMHLEAHDAYTRRANMNGWVPETAYAWYQAGLMAEQLNIADVMYYMRAFDLDSTRAEYMVAMAKLCRIDAKHTMAAIFSRIAISIERPDNGLFVEGDVYEWRALDEFVTVAYYTHFRDDVVGAALELLQRKFPETERARIEKNCSFYL